MIPKAEKLFTKLIMIDLQWGAPSKDCKIIIASP